MLVGARSVRGVAIAIVKEVIAKLAMLNLQCKTIHVLTVLLTAQARCIRHTRCRVCSTARPTPSASPKSGRNAALSGCRDKSIPLGDDTAIRRLPHHVHRHESSLYSPMLARIEQPLDSIMYDDEHMAVLGVLITC